MLKVGLTGGIGSGKTTVARIFEVLAVPVYYADAEAKKMMEEDPSLRQQIIRHFGASAYHEGKLNRPYLAASVFSDPEKTRLMNSLVHPATIRHATAWMRQQQTPYAIKEAALVFESGAEKELDVVIGVSAPLALRMQRVQLRDGLSAAAIQARIDRQMEESEKLGRCDFVIVNDEQELLIPQVVSLHAQLLQLAAAKNHS